MNKIFAGLLVSLFITTLANAASLPGDTLSKPYLDATAHWLYGRTEAADRSLRLVATQANSASERASATELLLDELYFWPGKYQQYIQLADSLNFRTNQYNMTRLLVQQPSQQIQLTGDSLQIPFKIRNNAHVVVTVLMNGQPVRLAVDSGAQRTFISSRKAQKIGISKLGDMQIQNYNQKSVPGMMGMADSLRLDNLVVHNFFVGVSRIPIPGIDGLLGWDLLRQFAFTIDYPNRRLTLRRSVPDSTLAANLLGGSVPMLLLPGPAKSNLLLQLDTGANERLRLSPLGQTKIGPYKAGKKIGISSSIGQPLRIRWEKFVKTLILDIDGKPQQFRRIPFFDANGKVGQFVRDGLIGSRAFRTGRLTLDAPNHHYEYNE